VQNANVTVVVSFISEGAEDNTYISHKTPVTHVVRQFAKCLSCWTYVLPQPS